MKRISGSRILQADEQPWDAIVCHCQKYMQFHLLDTLPLNDNMGMTLEMTNLAIACTSAQAQ